MQRCCFILKFSQSTKQGLHSKIAKLVSKQSKKERKRPSSFIMIYNNLQEFLYQSCPVKSAYFYTYLECLHETYSSSLICGLACRRSSKTVIPGGPIWFRLRLITVTSDGLLLSAAAKLLSSSSVRPVFLRISCSTSSELFSTSVMASI